MKTPKSLSICAVLSGLMMCAAFTFNNLWWLCFFALIPLLTAMFTHNQRPCGQKKAIFLYIFSYYLPMMLWLYSLYPLTQYGIKEVPSAILLTLAVFAIAAIEGIVFIIAFLPYNRLRKTKIPLPVTFTALYIFGEFLQGVLGEFSFPWGRTGTIVCEFTPFAQSADLLGTLFVSMLIVFINALLAQAIVFLLAKGRYRKPVCYMLCAILLFAANLSYGFFKKTPQTQTCNVAVIQGNLGSMSKWDTTLTQTIHTYLTLTERALENFDADIILWPETAIPVYTTDTAFMRVTEFARQKQCTIVTGAFTRADNQMQEYNSLVACYPDGTISAPYHKQKLVPMGEYIPFYDILQKFIPATEPYLIPGTSEQPIPAAGRQAGGIICYESIYPQVARKEALAGATFYLMSSNDSWFGFTPALRQHLAHARMRCIENGRWMARAGNTGISAILDAQGRIVCEIQAGTADILCAQIAVNSDKTLYTTVGDILALPCFAVWAAGFFLWFYRGKTS